MDLWGGNHSPRIGDILLTTSEYFLEQGALADAEDAPDFGNTDLETSSVGDRNACTDSHLCPAHAEAWADLPPVVWANPFAPGRSPTCSGSHPFAAGPSGIPSESPFGAPTSRDLPFASDLALGERPMPFSL